MTFEMFVRSVLFADHRPLSVLLEQNIVHRHLDWREPLSWIDSRPFLVLERQGNLIGALACPPDPPGVAWLRLFAFMSGGDGKEIWQLLWEAASNELSPKKGITVAAIVMLDWMTPLLVASGFTIQQSLVMLEKNDGDFSVPAAAVPGSSIRPMQTLDLPSVVEVDAASFEPLWQNSLADLTRALSRALLASVAEVEGQVVGYQISTRTSLGIHLARLAVRPEWQGRGMGQALVRELLSQAETRGIRRVTVNTQSDNSSSLLIYKKLGFFETGERYPVYKRLVSL
jgi:ribosomal-protein-alanine N-acetyltransferase